MGLESLDDYMFNEASSDILFKVREPFVNGFSIAFICKDGYNIKPYYFTKFASKPLLTETVETKIQLKLYTQALI